jgi:hypothetical protein
VSPDAVEEFVTQCQKRGSLAALRGVCKGLYLTPRALFSDAQILNAARDIGNRIPKPQDDNLEDLI